jgi:peptide/nickel transport system ATP-binding protein
MIQVHNLQKNFIVSKALGKDPTVLYALNGINLDIQKGEVCCVVGESGCGKTTLGRVIMGLLAPTSGEIYFASEQKKIRLDVLNKRKRKEFRKQMQMIFQNPQNSLNPRMRVGQIIIEPLNFYYPHLKQKEMKEMVTEILLSVGGDSLWLQKFPHEFSGGQQQRISIARALASKPSFLVADEPVSALDVSVQAQVLNLLMELKETRKLTYLFISHDMSVIRHIGTKVVVMYLGAICEVSNTKEIFSNPKHPYTQLLLSAIPEFGKKSLPRKAATTYPSPFLKASGCRFAGRCPYAYDRCHKEIPQLRKTSKGATVACHAVEEKKI